MHAAKPKQLYIGLQSQDVIMQHILTNATSQEKK